MAESEKPLRDVVRKVKGPHSEKVIAESKHSEDAKGNFAADRCANAAQAMPSQRDKDKIGKMVEEEEEEEETVHQLWQMVQKAIVEIGAEIVDSAGKEKGKVAKWHCPAVARDSLAAVGRRRAWYYVIGCPTQNGLWKPKLQAYLSFGNYLQNLKWTEAADTRQVSLLDLAIDYILATG